MAAPTDPDFLNEWGVYIGGVIAAVVSGFFARISLTKGRSAGEPETYHQVAGALVDSSSVANLSASIEAINITLMTIHRDSETVGKARVETLKAMVAAVEALAKTVAHSNVLTEREEEERERREREALEREVTRLREKLRGQDDPMRRD